MNPRECDDYSLQVYENSCMLLLQVLMGAAAPVLKSDGQKQEGGRCLDGYGSLWTLSPVQGEPGQRRETLPRVGWDSNLDVRRAAGITPEEFGLNKRKMASSGWIVLNKFVSKWALVCPNGCELNESTRAQ